MFEKVSPSHPDKIADRIAGALVDLAYAKEENPRIAVEVQVGHGVCNIIAETSVKLNRKDIGNAVARITKCNVDGAKRQHPLKKTYCMIDGAYSTITEYDMTVCFNQFPQDWHLAKNQSGQIRCGDNGIFHGYKVTEEQKMLTKIAREIYAEYPTDGKYLIDAASSGGDSQSVARLVICQSNAREEKLLEKYPFATVNPLGDWTGGLDVDTGATNRKLSSDMGDSATSAGLFGKDLSKADVSLNIYAWLKAQQTGKPVELCCAIGDEYVNGIPYGKIVEIARKYINKLGGFEKFAEWGLIR